MSKKKSKVHPYIKHLLGFKESTSDAVFHQDWRKRSEIVCKPCWELKYCPYGPLVEQFPLPPPTRKDAIEHNEFLKKQIAAGAYDKVGERVFRKQIAEFNPKDYPVAHSRETLERSCSVFGHICPVFIVGEPFTETEKRRQIGRRIPRETMLRVVRRDNNQCQVCSRILRDDEIEFDHLIPVSKGGSSEEHNLRITCLECNRGKSDKYKP